MFVGRDTCICYNFTKTCVSWDPFSFLLPMLFVRPHRRHFQQCSAKCPLMAIGNFSRSAVMWRFLQALKLSATLQRPARGNLLRHFSIECRPNSSTQLVLERNTGTHRAHVSVWEKKVETCPQLAWWGYEGPPPGIVVVMTRIPFGEHRDRATVQDDSSRREGSRFRLVAQQVT